MIGLKQAAAAALSAVFGLSPASASPQVSVYRQWRIVYHVDLKVTNYWWSGALVAPSRDQAWAVGFTERSGGTRGYFLEHWNGVRWRMSAVPGVNLRPDAVAASGPDNVWLFSNANRAFVWDGQRWAAAQGTRGMSMSDAVVLGPSDVWTVASRVCGTGALDHWTGTGWSTVTFPEGITAISGSSPRNFWVLTRAETSTTYCRPVSGAPLHAYRWNGSSFQQVQIPRIVVGHSVGPGPFAVSSPRDIWFADWSQSTIWHWNGYRWARISVKAPGVYVTPAPVVPDGRGGAWIGGCWHWLRGVWHPIDYSRDGCQETFGLARIPGTTSAWRLGLYTFSRHEEGTIEVNGLLP
ncbi:MAG TPA: hypothetical protein VF834_26185 [Streptosporangiaceae bacterium]